MHERQPNRSYASAAFRGARPSPLAGIGLKVASVCVLLTMQSLVKAAGDVPPGQLVFFRSIFAILPIVVFLAARRELIDGIKTRHPWWHLLRGVLGTGAMGCSFFALTKLPLAEAVTINYATPLLIVVFGAVFVGETVRAYRWSAVLIGLVGVAVIVGPQLTLVLEEGGAGGDETVGVVAALAGTCIAAFSTLAVRKLVETERSATVVLYFSALAALFSLVTVPFGWVTPTPAQTAMLVSAGICGGIGQILLTECYRRAEMSVVAPFEYTSLVLSIIIGYVVFSDIPTASMLTGGLIVTGAGIFVILREHRLGIDRAKARQVTSLQG